MQRLSQLTTGGESDCSHPSSPALMGIEIKEIREESPASGGAGVHLGGDARVQSCLQRRYPGLCPDSGGS